MQLPQPSEFIPPFKRNCSSVESSRKFVNLKPFMTQFFSLISLFAPDPPAYPALYTPGPQLQVQVQLQPLEFAPPFKRNCSSVESSRKFDNLNSFI